MNTPAMGSSVRAGFTLIELLVSIVILGILVLGVAAVLNYSANTIRTNNAGLDALRAGEASFSTLARDVGLMVIRPDVDYGFVKTSGNDSISFYARAIGLVSGTTSSARPLSIVAYRIGQTTDGEPRLEYAAKPVGWADSTGAPQMKVAPRVSGTSQARLDGSGTLVMPSDAEFTSLAGEIVRLEVCFLMQEKPSDSPRLVAAPPAKIEHVKALVAAAVVLDERGRNLVPNLATLAGLFPDATDGSDLQSLWEPIRNNPDALRNAGLPLNAQAGLRVVQRYLPLSP